MERKEFLSQLGIGLVIACTGCGLSSCGGSKSSNPAPVGVTPGAPPPAPGSGNLFTADLNTDLLNIGDSRVSGGVILVRIASGNTPASFTAVQVACTHQGTAINYNNGQGIFICPLHGSEFSKTGQLLLGPATSPLKEYTVTIINSILTVTA